MFCGPCIAYCVLFVVPFALSLASCALYVVPRVLWVVYCGLSAFDGLLWIVGRRFGIWDRGLRSADCGFVSV